MRTIVLRVHGAEPDEVERFHRFFREAERRMRRAHRRMRRALSALR